MAPNCLFAEVNQVLAPREPESQKFATGVAGEERGSLLDVPWCGAELPEKVLDRLPRPGGIEGAHNDSVGLEGPGVLRGLVFLVSSFSGGMDKTTPSKDMHIFRRRRALLSRRTARAKAIRSDLCSLLYFLF